MRIAISELISDNVEDSQVAAKLSSNSFVAKCVRLDIGAVS